MKSLEVLKLVTPTGRRQARELKATNEWEVVCADFLKTLEPYKESLLAIRGGETATLSDKDFSTSGPAPESYGRNAKYSGSRKSTIKGARTEQGSLQVILDQLEKGDTFWQEPDKGWQRGRRLRDHIEHHDVDVITLSSQLEQLVGITSGKAKSFSTERVKEELPDIELTPIEETPSKTQALRRVAATLRRHAQAR